MVKFFGKYRAIVTNNIDPEKRLRLRIRIPDVLGTEESWAVSCLPEGLYALPEIGTGVWVEFEMGNPNYPIWVGCIVEFPIDIPIYVS